MRRLLMVGCAVVALQAIAPAGMALTEPQKMRDVPANHPLPGDDRVRQAWWRPGTVIKLIGSEGRSLMVEMPKGMRLDSFDISEQSVIKPDEFDEIDPVTGKPIPKPKIEKEEGCVKTVDIKICVKRERFLFFVPYVRLDAQPFPMIMLENKKKEEIEHAIIFELSTVPEEGERPYYSVKVLAGDPPPPALSTAPPVAGAAASVSRETPKRPVISWQDRARLRELDRAPQPPEQTNSKYLLQGDMNLIGR